LENNIDYISDDYDSPWKDMLNDYFEQFMSFFFPKIYDKIDWIKGYESLDKELHQITREAKIGGRLADKLFKVWSMEGEEIRVLVHVEVQAQKKAEFSHKTYVYNYRIYELYKLDVVSLAVLADENPKWRPSVYYHKRWGCSTAFRFPAVKILDYRDNKKALENLNNPFAVVVKAHLKTIDTKKDYSNRRQWKAAIVKELYRSGLGRNDILKLFHFIDWIMTLPQELENAFYHEILEFEEEQNMRFVDIAERTGIEKGLKKELE